MSTRTITDEAIKAAAIKIIRWGIDEARERDAMGEEASDLLVMSVTGDIDAYGPEVEALIVRIEAAIDAIVPAEATR